MKVNMGAADTRWGEISQIPGPISQNLLGLATAVA